MKKIIYTPNAPNPVGPYSQAVQLGTTLYVSGQIAINPESGDLVNDSIEAETRQVMSNLKAILEAAGSSFSQVVKCEVFVSDMENYGRINKIYAEFFEEATAPARALVEVANLPKYVNVEISAIAQV
ncbi:MAG: Rid family detoxifying hydrolase [Bacteroidota bacterium]